MNAGHTFSSLLILAAALPALAHVNCWGRRSSIYNHWCESNCNHNPPNCDMNYCECESVDESDGEEGEATTTSYLTCRGAGRYASITSIGKWCESNCNHEPAFCPPSFCDCETVRAAVHDDHSAGDWGYCDDDESKADHEYVCDKSWSDEFPTCGEGQKQSPIDLVLDHAIVVDSSDPLITFSSCSCSSFTISRPDLSWGASFDCDDCTITFNGTTYTLASGHIHHPSEHTFDGVATPMELHMIHTTETVTSGVESTLVVGIPLVEASSDTSSSLPWLDHLVPSSPSPTSINPYAGIADGVWFTYEGSLTTPPCSEGLRWVVNGVNGQVGSELMDAFAQGLQVWPRTHLKHGNAREVQPLNERDVLCIVTE